MMGKIDNVNPATGRVVSTIPRSKAADGDAAVAAAVAASEVAAATPLAERAALLERVSRHVDENLEAFALAESQDSGKPLKLAQHVDIPRAVSNLRFFAGAAPFHPQAYHHTDGPFPAVRRWRYY